MQSQVEILSELKSIFQVVEPDVDWEKVASSDRMSDYIDSIDMLEVLYHVEKRFLVDMSPASIQQADFYTFSSFSILIAKLTSS